MEKIHCLAIPLFVSGLIVSAPVIAGEYRSEMSLGYAQNKVTSNFYWAKDRVYFSKANIYFTPVETQNRPLAEAAFLGEHSFVSLGYSKYNSKNRLGFENPIEVVSKDSYSSIYTRIYVPNTPLVLGYGDSLSEDSVTGTYTIGLAPAEGLLLYTLYWRDDETNSRPNIYAEYVRPLADDRALRINAGFTNAPGDQSNAYELAGDYYFNSRWSAGLTWSGHGEFSSYGLRSRYFFTEQFSVSADYNYGNSSDDLNGRTLSAGLELRF